MTTRVLIHIGYPKAGSTYLQTWFSKHPSFFYGQLGITGFYSSRDISKYAATEGKVHECFVMSSEHLSAWKGEPDMVGLRATKFYDVKAYQEKICETLHHIYPNAKILIVTRGYTTFFPSFYAQYLSVGGTLSYEILQKDFNEFFSSVLDYSRVITLYREKFGTDSVIVLPFELLRDNPVKFTSLIEKKLEIMEHFEISRDKVNPALDWKLLSAYYRFSNIIYRLVRPLPYAIQKVLYGFYINRLTRNKPNVLMKFLEKFTGSTADMKGLDRALDSVRGKAEVLRNEKLYEPYLKDYLID